MKRILIAISVITVIAACGKDDDGAPQTNRQLLTASVWKYDTAGIDLDGNGEIDNAIPNGYILPCHKDNTILFKDNETGEVNEGPLKCNQTDPQTANFTWSTNNNQNVINFSDTIFGQISGDVTIKKITASELVLTKQISVGPITAPALIRLKH